MLRPRFVMTDATFELRISCIQWIVVYIGPPSIGDMVGFSKLSMS